MKMEFERLERWLIKKAHIFEMYEDTLRLPDGNTVVYDFLSHKGAAAVIPVLPDGRILMVRQYRPSVDRITVEVPAGGRNTREEDFILAARRELEEETGYISDDISHLVTLNTAVAFSDEVVEVYVARNLKKTEQHLDAEEFIEVVPYTVSELKTMISSGEIQDAKTVSSIMAYLVYCF